MDNVTFKLPADIMTALEQRAKQFKGVSRHQLARQVVIDYLNDVRLESIESELIEFRIELNKLRDNLASGIEIVLLKAGNTNRIEEVQSWIAKTFY